MNRARVLLADDHRLVSEGLKGLLEPEFEWVGIVEDGRSLLKVVSECDPDVVILDISMPLLNGIQAGAQLKKDKARVKIVFLTMHTDASYAIRALEVRASASVLKHAAASERVTAIHEALKGNTDISPKIAGEALKSFMEKQGSPSTRRDQDQLTLRPREVLQLLAEGHAVKEVAAVMNISPRTVEFHKYRIMENLNLRTHADLVKFAFEHGMTAS